MQKTRRGGPILTESQRGLLAGQLERYEHGRPKKGSVGPLNSEESAAEQMYPWIHLVAVKPHSARPKKKPRRAETGRGVGLGLRVLCGRHQLAEFVDW
jgi:hypothetical protein